MRNVFRSLSPVLYGFLGYLVDLTVKKKLPVPCEVEGYDKQMFIKGLMLC